MNRSVASLWLVIVTPLLIAETPPQARRDPVSPRIEIRVDISANRESGPVEPCDVAQASSGNPVAFWGTFGDAAPGKPEEGIGVVASANRCGGGAFSGPPAPGSSPAPFLILEASATPKWDPGPMDPGPVPVAQIVLSITSRLLTGFSPDGKPLYGDSVTDHRNVRLGEGEEFVLPVLLPATRARELPGVREVLFRVRAGMAGRPGATEYGAVAVMTAMPGSEVVVDGGVAGHVGADGSGLLPSVVVGQREVSLRSVSERSVVRVVSVVKGRTVLVSPEAVDGVAEAQPLFTPAGTNPQGFSELRRARDGAVMVRIPEGEFVMGTLETEGKPQPHQVYVSAYLMDKLPVTWGLFKRFAAATGRPLPPEPYWGIHDDHPVSFIRWDEGQAYCEWAGGRLPTEAEREKAARGTDGRKFPWGNEEPSPDRGVFRRNWGYEGTDAVGIRPAGASPYGLLDTGGNVWEYCQDWYDPDYYKSSPREDPTGPGTGRARVVRGGSWDSRPTVLGASCRNWGYVGYREGDFGFRCAADAPR
jgi:formylglycine-generating enzyme required for sulfatase activity